jgi:hypothetical protein
MRMITAWFFVRIGKVRVDASKLIVAVLTIIIFAPVGGPNIYAADDAAPGQETLTKGFPGIRLQIKL